MIYYFNKKKLFVVIRCCTQGVGSENDFVVFLYSSVFFSFKVQLFRLNGPFRYIDDTVTVLFRLLDVESFVAEFAQCQHTGRLLFIGC